MGGKFGFCGEWAGTDADAEPANGGAGLLVPGLLYSAFGPLGASRGNSRSRDAGGGAGGAAGRPAGGLYVGINGPNCGVEGGGWCVETEGRRA